MNLNCDPQDLPGPILPLAYPPLMGWSLCWPGVLQSSQQVQLSPWVPLHKTAPGPIKWQQSQGRDTVLRHCMVLTFCLFPLNYRVTCVWFGSCNQGPNENKASHQSIRKANERFLRDSCTEKMNKQIIPNSVIKMRNKNLFKKIAFCIKT